MCWEAAVSEMADYMADFVAALGLDIVVSTRLFDRWIRRPVVRSRLSGDDIFR